MIEYEKILCNRVSLYLEDHEVTPQPIRELIESPHLYIRQLILLAPHWRSEERVGVAKIFTEKLLTNVNDCTFYPPTEIEEIHFVNHLISIQFSGDIPFVNSPARDALARATACGVDLKESWMGLYMFVWRMSRSGIFFQGVNSYSQRVRQDIFHELQEVEKKWSDQSRKALRESEGDNQ